MALEEGAGVLAKPALGALRVAYRAGVDELVGLGQSMRAAGASAEDTLRTVNPLRNALKQEIRAQGPWWAARLAEFRNLVKYGNPTGPTADWMLGEYGNAQDALDALERTDPTVNQWVGLGGP